MNEEELFNEWLKTQGLEDVDPLEYIALRNSEEFQYYLLRRAFSNLADAMNTSLTYVSNTITEIAESFSNGLRELLFDNINLTEGLPRTPVEIKKDIKHAKNPLQLKQLNQELNKSYKYWKKRKGH
jgi:hypothetical protein